MLSIGEELGPSSSLWLSATPSSLGTALSCLSVEPGPLPDPIVSDLRVPCTLPLSQGKLMILERGGEGSGT